jgi:hypothetical protein
VNGSFKTNHNVAKNQLALLKQARSTLWATLHAGFKIKAVVFENNIKHLYMDNETFEHRKLIFNQFETFAKLEPSAFKPLQTLESSIKMLNTMLKESSVLNENTHLSDEQSCFLLNTFLEKSQLALDRTCLLANCCFKGCKLNIGSHTYISDLNMVLIRIKVNLKTFI